MSARIHPSVTTIGLLLGALAATGCARAEAAPAPGPEPDPIRVTTVKVEEHSLPKTLLLTGSVTAHRTSDVASSGAGKVVDARIERGSRVEKGAILARLDTRASGLAAAEASASASAARSQERLAKLECQRAERLFAQSVISSAEHDRMKSGCETATAGATAASARAARASKDVSDGVIRAPFSGIVVERFVDVGEFVGPGTKVARIVERDPMRVELSVPESAVTRLSKDQKLTFGVAPLPGRELDARIRFIGPVLDSRTRNLVVEAEVESEEPALMPGMFATSRLSVGARRELAIPEAAITGSASSPRAFVVVDGHAVERVLRLGERSAGLVAVEKGLSKGEEVVMRPDGAVRDGARVNRGG